jgi:Na+/H+ antiporter NhaC
MSGDAYGPLSLLPPFVAIVLAIVTRRVVISLLLGVAVGAMLLNGGYPLASTISLVRDHLWVSLVDPGHLHVFAFTLTLGAMVGVIYRSGGMHAVIAVLSPLARNRCSGQLVTWFLGLLVFFDDYANTLLLGSTMRPLADRLRISRAKLAYLVDSTAAPVAGLAVVSTWVAGEIGFIQAGLDLAEVPRGAGDGFSLFVATIPYRFYVLFALAFLPLVALLQRDFGPMLRAEREALQTDPGPEAEAGEDISGQRDVFGRRWILAVLPVAVVIGVTTAILITTGAAQLEPSAGSSPGWIECFTHGDSLVALLYGSLSGFATAVLLALTARSLDWIGVARGAWIGARQMGTALVILWLAWALSAMTSDEHLATARYVSGWLEGYASPVWLPTLVFVLSSVIAFATGTSWGTMGILMPLVVDTSYKILAAESVEPSLSHPILLAATGSVLAGAIFGDHCSPISDTTVLSSQASGCDHMLHVRTQMPYALVVAAVSIVFGTIPIGLGLPVWPLLPIGLLVLAVAVRFLGTPTDLKGRQNDDG